MHLLHSFTTYYIKSMTAQHGRRPVRRSFKEVGSFNVGGSLSEGGRLLEVLVLLFLGFSIQLSNAMHAPLNAFIDTSIEISHESCGELEVLKEFIEKGPSTRNCVLTIKQVAAEKMGRVCQLLAGINAYFVSNKNGTDSLKMAFGKDANSGLLGARQGDSVHNVSDVWHRCLNAGNNVNPSRISFVDLEDLHQKVKDDKIDLHARHQTAFHGFILLPEHMEKIKEIDVSGNHLPLSGIGEMKPFQLFHNLTRLNLAYNKLDRLPAHFFASIPSCLIVSVANNEIKVIEADAFAGAKTCLINMCGNPIETVAPGAMDGGQNHIIVLCSKRLPQEVLNAMKEQLEKADWATKSLRSCHSIMAEVFKGYTPYLIVCVSLGLGSLALLPLFHATQIRPTSAAAICITCAYTLIMLGLLYKVVKMTDELCKDILDRKKNKLMMIRQKDENNAQRQLFES